MGIKTVVVPSDKFTNVQNFYLNGKRHSSCDWWRYCEENQAFVYNGKTTCRGWYKKGITIFNKCQDDLYSQF